MSSTMSIEPISSRQALRMARRAEFNRFISRFRRNRLGILTDHRLHLVRDAAQGADSTFAEFAVRSLNQFLFRRPVSV